MSSHENKKSGFIMKEAVETASCQTKFHYEGGGWNLLTSNSDVAKRPFDLKLECAALVIPVRGQTSEFEVKLQKQSPLQAD